MEERIRDILCERRPAGYSCLPPDLAGTRSAPEAENTLDPALEYVRIKNPITPDRTVLRRSSLATMLELLEHNHKFRPGLAMFELGPVFLPVEGQLLPDEALRLTIGMTGTREYPTWQNNKPEQKDFFDLKGAVETLLKGLHIENVSYQPAQHPSFHPGKCAEVWAGEQKLGVLGELHPLVREHYEFESGAVLAAELDADLLVALSQTQFNHQPISSYPFMVEDIALIVPEETPRRPWKLQFARQEGNC
jgi:phenylalanyl-tRNA synthetase beta chain